MDPEQALCLRPRNCLPSRRPTAVGKRSRHGPPPFHVKPSSRNRLDLGAWQTVHRLLLSGWPILRLSKNHARPALRNPRLKAGRPGSRFVHSRHLPPPGGRESSFALAPPASSLPTAENSSPWRPRSNSVIQRSIRALLSIPHHHTSPVSRGTSGGRAVEARTRSKARCDRVGPSGLSKLAPVRGNSVQAKEHAGKQLRSPTKALGTDIAPGLEAAPFHVKQGLTYASGRTMSCQSRPRLCTPLGALGAGYTDASGTPRVRPAIATRPERSVDPRDHRSTPLLRPEWSTVSPAHRFVVDRQPGAPLRRLLFAVHASVIARTAGRYSKIHLNRAARANADRWEYARSMQPVPREPRSVAVLCPDIVPESALRQTLQGGGPARERRAWRDLSHWAPATPPSAQ